MKKRTARKIVKATALAIYYHKPLRHNLGQIKRAKAMIRCDGSDLRYQTAMRLCDYAIICHELVQRGFAWTTGHNIEIVAE